MGVDFRLILCYNIKTQYAAAANVMVRESVSGGYMSKLKPGAKTLLLSIIMSSPGPLVAGISLLNGKSTTQIADFVRRSAEFLAIVVSFIIFSIISKKDESEVEKIRSFEKRSDIYVGSMMCLAGVVMAILTATVSHEDKGNVVPGLVIAILSISGNCIFWRKYVLLNKLGQSRIFSSQARLYRGKTIVDAGVIIALSAVIISPDSVVTICLDLMGSVIVAFYLIYNGAKTIRGRNE